MTHFMIPVLILAAGAFLIYLLTRLLKLSNRTEALIATLILGAALTLLVFAARQAKLPLPQFGAAENDGTGIIFEMDMTGVIICAITLAVGMLVCLYSGEYLQEDPRHFLYYPLTLLLCCGLLGIFFTRDLFNLVLLTELTTVAASALIAFRFHQETAIKAGFKYLIMSSLGTMIMFLGLYFVYRGTGTLSILPEPTIVNNFTRIGGGCFLLGFSLKAGVVPLHTWVPEVYSHAPGPISGLLAGPVSKSMLFMLPNICLRLGITSQELGLYLVFFAMLNMLVGSIQALNQRHVPRFLSFSTIAQTGYLMFALGIALHQGRDAAYSAALFLFLVIAVTKCLAFLSSGIYEHHLKTNQVENLAGLHQTLPLPAYSFGLALAGMAGIPLLAGFTGKWLVFSSALAAADWPIHVGLAVFLISTLIGLGGYLPLLIRPFLPGKPDQKKQQQPSWWMGLPVVALSGLVILMGVIPGPWLGLVNWIVDWIKLR